MARGQLRGLSFSRKEDVRATPVEVKLGDSQQARLRRVAEMVLRNKVAVLPCTGVGQVVGTIARQAAYRVCDDQRPGDTVLVCLPALVKGVEEDIDMIRMCPVIAIEGCKERCATHALGLQGGKPSATVSVPEVIKGRKLRIRREARRRLTESEQAVVELVAESVVAQVDKLKRGGSDVRPDDASP